jgi:uncharacterized membrane protein
MPINVPIGENAAGVDFTGRTAQTTTVAASPSGATETTIATITIPTGAAIQAGVMLRAFAAFTVGTSGTAVRLRIRQTNTSGTTIADTGALTGGVAAGNLLAETVLGFDTSPSATGQVYVLTLTVTAGAAASTVSAVEFDALEI